MVLKDDQMHGKMRGRACVRVCVAERCLFVNGISYKPDVYQKFTAVHNSRMPNDEEENICH